MIQKCESGGTVYTSDLKSDAARIEGSIPSSRTNHRAYSLMVKRSTHNRLSLGSIPSGPTKKT